MVAAARAIKETYLTFPNEKEARARSTDLSRKLELFWRFTATLGYESTLLQEKAAAGTSVRLGVATG